MARLSAIVVVLALAPLALLAGDGGVQGVAEGAPRARAAAPSLPLYFVKNNGQTDPRARYYVQGKDSSVFFTRRGLALSLVDGRRADRRFGLRLDFLGGRGRPEPVGRARTPAVVSYFKGRPEDWRTGIPTYSKVAYRDVWPGIDLIYSSSQGRLKYDFLVKPGADPEAIRLGWRGATGLDVGRRGELVVATPARTLRDDAPRSYQRVGGRRVAVSSSYALGPGHSYGFRVGSFDKSRPLVIDPASLVYAGFIGGSGDEQANNVALDEAKNLYVSGSTTSNDFPAQVGPDASFNDASGLDDAFVAKVNPSGTGLVYAGYIGGAQRETSINIAVDDEGAAYLDGSTSSSEADGFPVIGGPDTTYNGGPQDAWLAKVRPDGTGLVHAGYIGGSGPGGPAMPNEQANGLDVDAAGNAYVSGFTGSDEASFPDGDGFGPVPGYDQTFNSPAFLPIRLDAFVVKVRPDGSGLQYATYVGGGGADAGTGLTIDSDGNAYANVFTGSSTDPGPFGGFPVTSGSFDPTFNGAGGSPAPDDVAAVKLNPSGTQLVYATYIGGAGIEQPFGNSVDSAGNVHITGYTGSNQSTFPNGEGFGSRSIPGFDQTFNGGTNDTFVVKLNASGSALRYATYIGGADDEQAVAIDTDSAGSAHVFGTTGSTQSSFPVANGPDSTYNGGETDAFIAKLNPAGTRLGYAGYIGGAGNETGIGVAVDGAGDAYVAGLTDSDQSSFPATRGPDVTKNGPAGSTDAFVAKITAIDDTRAPVISALTASPAVFAAARSARATGRPRGTRFRYRLSEAASVRFSIERRTLGRRVGRRCLKQTRGNRGRRSCARYVGLGSLSQRGVRGRNQRRFSGRLKGRPLRPGRYRVSVVATDPAGNRSRTRRTGFRVVRR